MRRVEFLEMELSENNVEDIKLLKVWLEKNPHLPQNIGKPLFVLIDTISYYNF